MGARYPVQDSGRRPGGAIDLDPGILENIKPLDREHMELFSLCIGAFEVGSAGSLVEDINDNPLVFSSDHYEVEVEEERFPGLAVLTGNILFSEIFSLLIYFHLYFMKYFLT